MNTFKKFSTISAAALLLLGGIFIAMPPASVYAQSPADEPLPPVVEILPDEPLPPAGQDGKIQNNTLERLYKAAQKVHENQQKLITQADKIGNRMAELIARAKENGKDTSALEGALAEFNVKIGEARLAFDQNGRLIKQHAGFDDAGKVTDTAAARATLEEIRAGGKEVRQTLADALKALREAGKAFREANPRPVRTVSPTQVPA